MTIDHKTKKEGGRVRRGEEAPEPLHQNHELKPSPKLKSQNPEPETQDPTPKTRIENRILQTRNPKPQTQTPHIPPISFPPPRLLTRLPMP